MLITFLALVVVGSIVSLATGNWWALVAAVLVHGLSTIVLFALFIPLLGRDDTRKLDAR